MAEKIALKDIVELKGCPTEEFIVLASEKGITISNEEDSKLSFAELKIIDPSLAYKLRYKRLKKQSTAKESISSKEYMVAESTGKNTQVSLRSLESLNSLAIDEPRVNLDFQKKNAVLQELVSMVNYAEMMSIENVR